MKVTEVAARSYVPNEIAHTSVRWRAPAPTARPRSRVRAGEAIGQPQRERAAAVGERVVAARRRRIGARQRTRAAESRFAARARRRWTSAPPAPSSRELEPAHDAAVIARTSRRSSVRRHVQRARSPVGARCAPARGRVGGRVRAVGGSVELHHVRARRDERERERASCRPPPRPATPTASSRRTAPPHSAAPVPASPASRCASWSASAAPSRSRSRPSSRAMPPENWTLVLVTVAIAVSTTDACARARVSCEAEAPRVTVPW